MKTLKDLNELTGISQRTLIKIIKHLGLEPTPDSYDQRRKWYDEDQVRQITQITDNITYTKKEN